MKKIYCILAIVFSIKVSAQITFDHSVPIMGYPSIPGGSLVKLHISGYKYLVTPTVSTGNTIDIYNLNHSLFKSITIPPAYVGGLNNFYISENLFDLDNGVEYLVWRYSTSTFTTNISIIDESGAVLFTKDSAALGGMVFGTGFTQQIFYNQDPVYFDGLATKLRMNIWNQYTSGGYKRSEIYTLPGSIPCGACVSGTVSGISVNNNPDISNPQFFPNPTSDQLKLKYKLPAGSHFAEMKIYDAQGKLLDEFKVTDTFDFIYLPTNYNNGLYLYSLIVDGKIIKTEKIVLNK